MRQVPAEILIDIISNLNQHNKLQCILVCKAWHTAIYSSVLFESLRLDSQQKHDLGLAYFRSEPEVALQVKKLYIDTMNLKDMKEGLPSLFPNLTEIEAVCDFRQDFLSEIEEIKKWKKLEKVIEFYEGSFSRAVLLSPSRHLRFLNMGQMEPKIQQDFVNCLKNAPNLEELRLRAMHATTFDYMEKLHAAVPRLNVLYMNLFYLAGGGEIDSATVQVATLKRFEFSIDEIDGPFDQWFEYIGRKYQQLEEIDITHNDEWYEPTYQPLLIKMLQQMPLLTSIDIHIAPLSEDMLISDNLNKIGFTADDDLKELEVLTSTAKKNITSFNVFHSPYDTIDEDMWREKFLRASSVYNLTELTISEIVCGPDTLIHLLNCFPNLKTLDLNEISFHDQNCQITRPKTTSVIQNLSLIIISNRKEGTLDAINLTLQYVLDACPLLGTFKFKQASCGTVSQGGIILDLQKHKKLKSFTVTAYYEQYFKFTHIPEKKDKRWKTFYTEVSEDEVEKKHVRQGNENYLDLAWYGYVDLHLIYTNSDDISTPPLVNFRASMGL